MIIYNKNSKFNIEYPKITNHQLNNIQYYNIKYFKNFKTLFCHPERSEGYLFVMLSGEKHPLRLVYPSLWI